MGDAAALHSDAIRMLLCAFDSLHFEWTTYLLARYFRNCFAGDGFREEYALQTNLEFRAPLPGRPPQGGYLLLRFGVESCREAIARLGKTRRRGMNLRRRLQGFRQRVEARI